MNATAIQWTDYTWNPVTGCDKVSPGCRNCYAEAWSRRFGRSFKVELHPERLAQVCKLESGSRVFVNSMSDLFHEEVPFEFVFEVFVNMVLRADVTFQVLTKRPGRVREFVEWVAHNRLDELNAAFGVAYPCAEDLPNAMFPMNVWVGTSIESRLYLPRLEVLRRIPAYVRFISFEPLLEDMGYFDLTSIRWVIAGGESGPHYRPMELDWVRNIRDRCRMADVAFFFKQSAGPRPGMNRTLEGREWNEFPDEVRA